MSRKISRNDPCPCGSGKKYKKCCIGQDFEWIETDNGDISRSVPLSEEAMELLEEIRDSQIRKYGKLQDRVFEGAPPLEQLEHWTVEAMKKAGIEPALIYAYEKTNGLLLNSHNERLVTGRDLEEWEAAIDEHERNTGQKALKRRLDDADMERMLQHGPGKQPEGFVTRLPFPPPFSKDKWGEGHMRSIIEEPEYLDYLERCQQEVINSGRSEVYLKLFCVMADGKATKQKRTDYRKIVREAMNRSLSLEELEVGLETVYLNCQPQTALPSAAAAFELVGFISRFVASYAEQAGFEDELSESLTKLHGLTLLAFVAAVNVELGLQPDIWKK